jgi:hypothetical protein
MVRVYECFSILCAVLRTICLDKATEAICRSNVISFGTNFYSLYLTSGWTLNPPFFVYSAKLFPLLRLLLIWYQAVCSPQIRLLVTISALIVLNRLPSHFICTTSQAIRHGKWRSRILPCLSVCLAKGEWLNMSKSTLSIRIHGNSMAIPSYIPMW